MKCLYASAGGTCQLEDSHGGGHEYTPFPSFLDGVNARLDDLLDELEAVRQRVICAEVFAAGQQRRIDENEAAIVELLGIVVASSPDRILVRQPEALPAVAPSEPDGPLPEWRDIPEFELDGSFFHDALEEIREESRPPLPAIGTRVRIEVSFPRVAKVVAHVGEGVEVELPGDSKRLWIAAGDVRTEG